MTILTLDDALARARTSLAKARETAMPAITCVVIDSGGNIQVALREGGAGFLGVEIAAGKARAALAFHCTSRQIADALAGNPLAGPSVLAAANGRLVLLGGGVPLHDGAGVLIGAIGVAGGAPDLDEAAALAGAA